MRLFGTSGVRGVVGEDITCDSVLKLGKAIGSNLPLKSTVVIGCDSRLSKDMVKASLTSGILSTGVNVMDVGIVPTPCLAWLTKKFKCAAGAMITASHNPPQFNGIKLWNPSTIGFSPDQEKTVEKIYFQTQFRNVQWDALGSLNINYTAKEKYMKAVQTSLSVSSDLTIVVDPGNGAASQIASDLFTRMGLTVLPIHDEPDGFFPSRPSEPREDTLIKTMEYVKEKNADFAVCFDGDADRVVFCDNQGFLGYNEMISFLSYIVCEKADQKVVATTVETGRLLDCAVEKAGGSVVRGRVGDVAVAHLIKEYNACIGVEQVGVYILPDIGMHPDSLYAALYLLNKIDSPSEIRDFVSSLPHMYFSKKGIPCPNNKKELIMRIVKSKIDNLTPEKVNFLDGIRLEFADSWLLIRPSGTEPLIRVICESQSQSTMETFLNEGSRIVSTALKETEENP
ncbi:MAG: phosphoglucosamine mutase [Candidatus Methanofastidiosia archaeon]